MICNVGLLYMPNILHRCSWLWVTDTHSKV